MDQAQAEALIHLLKVFGSEDATVEAKRAEDKLPESTIETL